MNLLENILIVGSVIVCYWGGDFPQHQNVQTLSGAYPIKSYEDRSPPLWKRPQLDPNHSRESGAENLTTEQSFVWPSITILFCFKWYVKLRLVWEATFNPFNVNVYSVLKLPFNFIQEMPVHWKTGSTIIITQASKFQNDNSLNNLEEFSFYTTDSSHCGHYRNKSLNFTWHCIVINSYNKANYMG